MSGQSQSWFPLDYSADRLHFNIVSLLRRSPLITSCAAWGSG